MYICTIQPWDIGQNLINDPIEGKIYLGNLMGYVQRKDVGKRIYKIHGIYQVENTEQMEKRLSMPFKKR